MLFYFWIRMNTCIVSVTIAEFYTGCFGGIPPCYNFAPPPPPPLKFGKPYICQHRFARDFLIQLGVPLYIHARSYLLHCVARVCVLKPFELE